ncbi:MAG: SAM-dependent chlorinase/fluorinase [Dehalococcoidales bacterium]|nr:SAM-dependent chlorinase/fluorinase [Dehalococcoidales bacterium]
MGTIITLTTDFGLSDGYIAAVKGVILSINPRVTIIDITHQIPPQNINQAAFVLNAAYKYFPPQTIHLVVVDPGVGTKRRAIILKTPRFYFVAPDNGLLSYVIHNYSSSTEISSKLEAVAITNPKYWLNPVSRTFHGRDIFAPVSAHLSLSVPMKEFGETISSVTILPLAEIRTETDGSIIGQVIHIDGFGNLVTNIKEADLPPGKLVVTIGNRRIPGLSPNYAQGEKLMALIGSSGYLEIAVREGSAASYLNTAIGSEVKVKINTHERD